MVSPQDALDILRLFHAHDIQVWLTGAWGVDALLGEVSRPHKDIDLIVLLDDVVKLRDTLSARGYELKQLWSENAWALDSSGVSVPTAFVLQDRQGRQVDAHAIQFDAQGIAIPAWNNAERLVFRPEDLEGHGSIAGSEVPCLSPSMQVVCHSGYTLPDFQVKDLALLHRRYGVGTPSGLPSSDLARPIEAVGRLADNIRKG